MPLAKMLWKHLGGKSNGGLGSFLNKIMFMLSLKGWLEASLIKVRGNILGRRIEYMKRPGNKSEQYVSKMWKKKNQYGCIFKCKEAFGERQIQGGG